MAILTFNSWLVSPKIKEIKVVKDKKKEVERMKIENLLRPIHMFSRSAYLNLQKSFLQRILQI